MSNVGMKLREVLEGSGRNRPFIRIGGDTWDYSPEMTDNINFAASLEILEWSDPEQSQLKIPEPRVPMSVCQKVLHAMPVIRDLA